MATKAKHAFGALERVDENITSGVLDSYDVLFVKDADGKPYVGWVSKDGQKEIINPYAEVSKLESQVDKKLETKASTESVSALETEMAAKASAEEVEALGNQIATKADASDVAELETEIANKVDAVTVKSMIEEATVGVIEVVEF